MTEGQMLFVCAVAPWVFAIGQIVGFKLAEWLDQKGWF